MVDGGDRAERRMWNAAWAAGHHEFHLYVGVSWTILSVGNSRTEVANLISVLVRWLSQSKVEVVNETKLDLRRSEKKSP